MGKSALVQYPLLAAGQHDAVLDIQRCMLAEHGLDLSLRPLLIFRMDQIEDRLEADAGMALRHAEDATGFGREEDLVGLRIPLPVAHTGDALRLLQPGLAELERLFDLLVPADILHHHLDRLLLLVAAEHGAQLAEEAGAIAAQEAQLGQFARPTLANRPFKPPDGRL